VTPIDHYRLRMSLQQASIAPWNQWTEGWIREQARRGDTNTTIDTAAGPIAVTSIEEARAVLRIHGPPLPRGDSKPIESSLFDPSKGHPAADGSRGLGRQKTPHKRPGNGAGRVAIDFLISHLSGGPQASTGVIKAARNKGISLITLRRAKRRVGVIAEPIRQDHRVREWVWRLG
jgi:hypothetical protein